MALIVFSLILIISFYLLGQVCDGYFIKSLDKIAKDLNMSHDMAGATLMAIGSSAPELFIAIIALLKPGNHEIIGMGTIVGSAIFNLLVITGAVALVNKVILSWLPVVRDMFFYSLSVLLLILAFNDGQIVLMEAAFFIIFYAVYVIVVMKWKKIFPYKEIEPVNEIENIAKRGNLAKITKPLDILTDKIFPSENHYIAVFIISIVIISLLSWVLVECAISISQILSIPEAIIALTVLAIGTSVPDMISSIIVARQGRGSMAISNAIGSNIFDILFGLGMPWFLLLCISGGTIPLSTDEMVSSVILLVCSVLIVFLLLLVRKWVIGRRIGYFFIGLYIAYLLWEVVRL